MDKELNAKEKSYLQGLFFAHHEKIIEKLNEEFWILFKYKLELDRNYKYKTIEKYNQTLMECMKDLLNNQDEIIDMGMQLGYFIDRIERYFLKENE
jgi:hypothetical protein